ncbi:hypothetical protein D3C87_1811970 [compost metagenome]
MAAASEAKPARVIELKKPTKAAPTPRRVEKKPQGSSSQVIPFDDDVPHRKVGTTDGF